MLDSESFDLGRPQKAEARVADRDPALGMHEFQAAARLFCNEDYEGARKRFSSLLLQVPDSPLLHAACGHCYLHLGEQDKARECYVKTKSFGVFEPGSEYNLAMMMLRSGEHRKAADALKRIHETPPQIERGTFYLGLRYTSDADFSSYLCLYIAESLLMDGQVSEAQNWLFKAKDADGTNVTVWQKLSEIAIQEQHYDEAIEHLKKIIEISPLEQDRTDSRNNLGMIYFEQGKIQQAIDQLSLVLKTSPTNPTAIHTLHHIYKSEGIADTRGKEGLPRREHGDESASPIFELVIKDKNSANLIKIPVVGKSSPMMRVTRHARVAAARDNPVLITGEKGTGKELFARLITLNSRRRDEPFTVVQCGSFPEVVLESEIFGHRKGAYTGAHSDKEGALQLSRKGTIFVDEITSLSPRLQGKLYRAMKEGVYTPLGGVRQVPLEARLITATTEEIQKWVEEGRFREDLFFALNIIPIDLPPLRDRREDIPLLVEHFLQKYSNMERSFQQSFSREDLQILSDYDWPGNVRELEHIVQRAVVMGSQSNLHLEEIARLRRRRAHQKRSERTHDRDTTDYQLDLSLSELERLHIERVLENVNGNQKKAAEILGINPSTLWRKLKSFNRKE